MGWLHSVLGQFRSRPNQLPTPATTRPELEVEKAKRRVEHNRTDRLARIIEDYRAQDGVIRR